MTDAGSNFPFTVPLIAIRKRSGRMISLALCGLPGSSAT
jgi:hypothetical protein